MTAAPDPRPGVGRRRTTSSRHPGGTVSRRFTSVSLAALALAVTFAPPAAARQSGARGSRAAAVAHGAVAARAPDGRLVVVAAEAKTPVRVDGALDDAVWREAMPVGGFVQSEPQDGQPATEPTAVRVAYDRTTLYIAAECHDSDPTGDVVNDIRKDFANTDQDTFEVIIDTFADRRNGFVFMTNREGARADQQVANEGREINASWDAVWLVRTRQTADGWTVEMAIPFKSLRFDAGVAELWGINFSRRIRRKNEVDFWSPVTRAHNLARLSLAGDLGRPARAHAGTQPAGEAVRRGTVRTGDRRRHGVRHERRRGARREVRRDAVAHARRHREPRLRAGGGRRAAGQPDAVQHVLPGEARLLPGELGHLLRGRRRAQQQRQHGADAGRGPAALPQPAHRPARGRHAALDLRRRPAHRPGRRASRSAC